MKYYRPYCDEEEKKSYPESLRDDEGRLLCVGRGCGKLLTGRKQRWCGKECVSKALATWDWGTARHLALKRDDYTCLQCGQSAKRPPYVDVEVDHISPLVEGGKLCDLNNLRTLCKRCHGEHTKALRVRLANQRRSA